MNPCGIILKTIDSGVTWTSTGINHVLNSVYFPDANTGYAVGGNDYMNPYGVIFKTTDGGDTWSELSSGTTHPLHSVFFTDVNTGYVAGDYGTIRKTINGGTTWTALQSGTSDYFNSVYFSTANKGYVVGNGGILKTINSGITWIADSSGTWNTLNSVFFTDTATGYVVGYSGTILKTGNGGETSVKRLPPQENSFTIYPNPANNRIRIITTKSVQEEILVTILTISGDPMMNDRFRYSNQIEMDVSMLAKGIYLVKIQTEEGMEVKKLVVE